MKRPARAVFALLALAVLAALGWGVLRLRRPAAGAAAPADTSQAGLRMITLWFADESGDSLVSESQEAPEQPALHERVSQLVDALVRGPSRRGVAVLPNGTRLLHAYLDVRGHLTLDLSRAFQQGFHGGSRAEDLIVRSLLLTVRSNLPEVTRVQVVCAGEPIASLGGHLPLDRPLDPHEVE